MDNNSNNKMQEPSFEVIQQYVNGDLSGQEFESFEQFLDNAPQDFLDLLEGVQLQKLAEQMVQDKNVQDLNADLDQEKFLQNLPIGLLEANPNPKTIPLKKKRFRNLGLLVAASLAFLLLFWWILGNNQTDKQGEIVDTHEPKDTLEDKKIIKPQDILDKEENLPQEDTSEVLPDKSEDIEIPEPDFDNHLAFAKNEEMEEWLNTNVRSDNVIEDILPKNDLIATKEIKFSWKNNIEEKLLLEILDNQGEVIKEFELEIGAEEKVLDLVSWKEGLYYWRLLDNRNLYHVGKFKKVK